MESSEDDAGTATNASRRASAREKDVGLAEEVNATSSFHQEPSEARPSCETPAMSEDNFDGDSVPSPTAQDVNTSTEAILDMIDEIVDGPGAPKRVSLASESVDTLLEELEITSKHLNTIQESTKSYDNNSSVPVVASLADSVNSELFELQVGIDTQAKVSSLSDTSQGILNPFSVVSLPESSPVPESVEPAVSTQTEKSTVLNVVPEASVTCVDSVPESSSLPQVEKPAVSTQVEDSAVSFKAPKASITCETVVPEGTSLPESEEPAVSTIPENSEVSNVIPASCVSSLPESSSLTESDEPVVPNVVSEATSLPESSFMPESDESAVSTQPEDSSVSNVISAAPDCVESIPECSSMPESDEPAVSTKPENSVQANVAPASGVSSLPESSSLPKSEEPAESTQPENSVVSNVVSEGTSFPESSSVSEPDECAVSTIPENSDVSNVTHASCLSTLPESLPLPESDEPAVSTQPENSVVTNVISEATSLPESSSMPEPEEPAVSTQPEVSYVSNVVSETPEAPASYVDSLPESSSLPEGDEPAVSSHPEESAVSNVVPEAPASCPPPNVPSSSEEKTVTVQNISNVSECETQERTVKCVSSSDSRDNVTVESAESTSSDSSVSEGRAVLVEPQVRSPLRRRLVRPAPSDRRPDSTVSSTVDSQIVNSPATEQKSCENITKDVTSSSDAVPTIHGNVKPEEIRNVSEINFCKAETSVSSPKKIKLIRQKLITATSNREASIHQSSIKSDKDQCQSTSSDNHSLPLPEPHNESLNTVSISQSQDNDETSISVSNCVAKKPVKSPEQAVKSEEHSQPSIEHCHPPQQEEVGKHVNSDQLPPAQPTLCLPNSSESEADADTDTNSSTIQEISSVPRPSSVDPAPDIEVNDLEQGIVSNVDKDEHKDTKDPECAQIEVLPLQESIPASPLIVSTSENSELEKKSKEVQEDQKKVPPFKLNLSMSNLPESKLETEHSSISKNSVSHEESEVTKQVPKLTIKLKQPDEVKSSVPKVTIKPIRPPSEQDSDDKSEKNQHIPSVTKINIKPILKPPENINAKSMRSQHALDGDARSNAIEQIPCITKLNIKPIPKPPEKINDIHRKSSSSEISESEYSENDETSTSDQASTSDHGPSDVVPKVTIKLGKPGTESEGKFYTEKNVPKVTIKGFQQDEKEQQEPKLKMVISQSELSSDSQPEKVPKLTIKTVSKSESQPLSPKLTIKPLKPPETPNKDGEIPKIKISTESFSSSAEVKESQHVPKITIKPVTRSSAMCDSPEHIPVVTKLNIKPILKPTDCGESSEDFDNKVPVVSKLNIKPVIKPKDNDVDSSVDDVPKITKLNIKPIKNPAENSSEEKDCDELNADIDENSIPVVTKINIKPIIKPQDEETSKESENQSSETGNSSDDNGDHIPVVTKLNIKPIIKPDSLDESSKAVSSSEQSIPVITKLNIKPLVKPGDSISPSSPKKEHSKMDGHSSIIPVVTKLNIKPVLRPEEAELSKSKDDSGEKVITKNPPLVMKINMKTMTENYNNEHTCNNIGDEKLSLSPKKKVANALETKSEICLDSKNLKKSYGPVSDVPSSVKDHSSEEKSKQNCVPDSIEKSKEGFDKTSVMKTPTLSKTEKEKHSQSDTAPETDSLVTGSLFPETSTKKEPNDVKANPTNQEHKNINYGTTDVITESSTTQSIGRQKYSSVQNCTLLKKLLENTKCSFDGSLEVSPILNYAVPAEKNDKSIVNSDYLKESGNTSSDKTNIGKLEKNEKRSSTPDKINDSSKLLDLSIRSIQDHSGKGNESITKPLEITISDKITNQSSGQDSPRIILKINKTDHGSSAKIITEDVKRPDTQQNYTENTQDIINDKQTPKKYVNNRRKQAADTSLNLSTGKRLRSSRIVENTEKTPIARRNMGKRPLTTETSPPQNKESDLSLLQTKRLKLGQLLSNKSLTITPVSKPSPPSPTKSSIDVKQGVRTVNHSLLNNENCSKNGNSKLHNILSNLQAKQMQTLHNNAICSEKAQTVATDIELNASGSNSNTVEIAPVENSHPELQEMIINENSDYRDLGTTPEEVSQDPLEVKPSEEPPEIIEIPKPVELTTPQPKKRGRPRKLPVSEGGKPAVTLPVPALEERPQRSLRLMRDRPAILQKPRGRGRGRGGKRAEATPPTELETTVVIEPADEPEDRPTTVDIDPTSSRIKLPRMTEALDKMPSVCVTPLTSRRRNSSGNFSTGETLEVKLESSKLEELGKTPEASGSAKGRGGRGPRGGRGRTPRGRGRGRGGGRGAMYMKETMGIYGRVCGPATTTVQLFEEETCMMDDNATPAKPLHLLDEDSQSSVKSSTNESNKLKKSKFADLFDSNKVWTAADVKEYTWPPPDKADVEHKVMMIQEQVAMFLGVKNFKRSYAELKRRTISGEERDYVLRKGVVTEALCDLGITAVDASEVLDIMLSDYPHKYEEFRSHQRQRQLTGSTEDTSDDIKTEDRVVKVEMKVEKSIEHKPELPKIDPEKTRQDMAAAAMASASEWNARLNVSRRGACADLQSHTVWRARTAPPAPPRAHLRPPAGFYPHALLPGQYQHSYRLYTPDQLRYFPLNTVLAAPPAPVSEDSSSESEPDWTERLSSSEDSDVPTHHAAKRKKLTKTKRSSQTEVASSSKEEPRVVEEVDLCRVCKMRLEANRKHPNERFLVCAHCNAKLHPSCLELSAETIRKCREYAWQCAECKTCCSCRQPADDDKMLFCDLCDRGFHIYCVGLDTVPSGRWHCVECAVCKSCGSHSPAGPGGASGAGGASVAGGAGGPSDWHHQTRRGPGGHKVYSHSLCTPCARAYRIGRYCPLCERSFIGPKGTMQLVICKLCDRQLHQDCVRQTVSNLNVLDYTCAECRRGGITSRAAAVRLAPRTIATLFMAKRRFNKYAHRQYLASRKREAEARDGRGPPDEPSQPGEPDEPSLSGEPDEPSLPDEPAPLRVHVPDEDASDASDAGADCGDTSDPLDTTPDA